MLTRRASVSLPKPLVADRRGAASTAHIDGAAPPAPGACLHPGGRGLTQHLIEACRFPAHACVLDLGCGAGDGVKMLSQAYAVQAYGIDERPEALYAGAHTWPNCPPCGGSLTCARLEGLPIASHTCDGLLAECSLSTVAHLDLALRECRRVLKAGGRLAITDLYLRSPHPGAPLPGLLDSAGWRAALAKHGFHIITQEDHTPALLAWVAQAMFAGQSLTSLWGCRPPAWANALPQSAKSLGYLMLIAQAAGASPLARM